MSLTSEPSLEVLPGPVCPDAADILPDPIFLATSKQPMSEHYEDVLGPLTPTSLEVLHIEEEGSRPAISLIPEHSSTTFSHPSGSWTEPTLGKAPVTNMITDGQGRKSASYRIPLSFSKVRCLPICSDTGSEGHGPKELGKKEQIHETEAATISVSDSSITSKAQVLMPKELKQENSFDQVKKVTLNKPSNSEVFQCIPKVHSERETVLPTTYKCELLNKLQWGSCPGTKAQLGHPICQDTEQVAEVRDPARASSCPNVAGKRHSQERTSRKNSLQDTPPWKEPVFKLAAAPEPVGNVWKAEMDLLPACRIPVERISTSGQAGTKVDCGGEE